MYPLSPLFIPSLGIGELALVLVMVLLLFGPGKLPKVAESLGEAVKRFRSGSEGKQLPDSKNPDSPADTPSNTEDSSDKG
jgi:sec-independent protein translocase protein TatA